MCNCFISGEMEALLGEVLGSVSPGECWKGLCRNISHPKPVLSPCCGFCDPETGEPLAETSTRL